MLTLIPPLVPHHISPTVPPPMYHLLYHLKPPPIPPHTTLSYHPHTTQPCPPRWYEKEQTRVGIQSVKSWAAEGNIDVDDLFISGNADEVLSVAISSWYLFIKEE